MSKRLLCVDSDIFSILAASGRLRRTAQLLDFPFDSLRRLPGLTSMLRKGNSFADFSSSQKKKILGIAETVTPFIERPEDGEALERLRKIKHIDEGESTLYAAVAEQEMMWLSSGDTRAMRALTSAEGIEDIKARVSSKIVSLESVMYPLIEKDGFAATYKAVKPVLHNRTLRSIFSTDLLNSANPLEDASQYLRHLCISLSRGFLYCPPCPESKNGKCTLVPLE